MTLLYKHYESLILLSIYLSIYLYYEERVVYGYLVLLTKMTKLFTTTVFWGVQPHDKAVHTTLVGGWMDVNGGMGGSG